MPADNEPAAPVEPSAAAPQPTSEGQPVVVPHIDFSTPTGNELVEVRKGYGLTPPPDSQRPAPETQEG